MPKETQSGSVRFRHDNRPGAPSAQRRGERVALVVALITLCFAIAGCAGSSPAGARPAPPPRATSAPSRPTTTEGQLTLRVRQAVGSAAKQVDLAYQAADGAAVVTVTLVWSPAWKVDFAEAQSVAKTVCYETQATLWTSGVALSQVTVTVLGQALDDYSDVITSAYAAATLTASHASAIQWPAITADEAWTRYDVTFMRPTYNPDWIYPPPATPTP